MKLSTYDSTFPHLPSLMNQTKRRVKRINKWKLSYNHILKVLFKILFDYTRKHVGSLFPDQGWKLHPLQWKCRVTGLPEKFHYLIFFKYYFNCLHILKPPSTTDSLYKCSPCLHPSLQQYPLFFITRVAVYEGMWKIKTHHSKYDKITFFCCSGEHKKQYFTESAQAKAFISFENKTFIMKRNSYTTEKDSNKDIIHKGISKIN